MELNINSRIFLRQGFETFSDMFHGNIFYLASNVWAFFYWDQRGRQDTRKHNKILILYSHYIYFFLLTISTCPRPMLNSDIQKPNRNARKGDDEIKYKFSKFIYFYSFFASAAARESFLLLYRLSSKKPKTLSDSTNIPDKSNRFVFRSMKKAFAASTADKNAHCQWLWGILKFEPTAIATHEQQ